MWNSAHSGDDPVESRTCWAAGGSSPTFIPESPDECTRAVMGVALLSHLFSLLSSFQFYKYLSLFSRFMSPAGPSRVAP